MFIKRRGVAELKTPGALFRAHTARGDGSLVNVQQLRDLSAQKGPFVSIYLDTSGAVENAAHKIETRWKDVLRELADKGVDQATRDALTTAKGDSPHLAGSTLVMFASGGQVHYSRNLPDAPAAEVIRVAPLPYLLPLIDWAQSRTPHVVVLTDRQGADILAYTDKSTPAAEESVDSARYPYHKTGTGGWSALRFEHKVEEDWKASAKEVAESVANIAHQVDAQLIIAAGDGYAVQGLGESLPEVFRGRYVVVDGGRAEDGSDELVADRVLEQLGQHAAGQTSQLLDEFGKYRGRAEKAGIYSPGALPDETELRAADGIAETVDALRKAQVGALLLSEVMNEEAPVYFGPEAVQIGLSADELSAMGVERAEKGALVDVLLRAALGTDADIRLVPADTENSPSEGVGALLRYGHPARRPSP